MKKLILSLLVMTSLMLMVVSVSGSDSLVEDAIIAGADRLVETQNNDGTWEWSDPDIDKTTNDGRGACGSNVVGVTAIGLVDAYKLTGNSAYLDAAEISGEALILCGFVKGTDKYYSQDIEFLVELGEATGYSKYTDKAAEIMNYFMTLDNRYCSPNGCTAEELAAYYQNHYSNLADAGITEWQLASWVRAAQLTGQINWANDMISEMNVDIGTYFNITDTQQTYYVIGLAGVVEATGNADAIQKLIDFQQVGGSWVDPNGVVQDTAYAVMALLKVNEKDAVLDAVNYLVDSQDGNGGWIESDHIEYTEVDSEAVQAISDFGDVDGPIFGETTIEPTYPKCADTSITINSIITDDSGVAFAELYWKYDESDVHKAPQFEQLENGLWITHIFMGEPEDEMEITYKIQATDNVGNKRWSSDIYEHLFTYDCLPPETTLTIGDPKYNEYITSDTEITLTCIDGISECDKTYYQIDEGNLKEYSAPFNVLGNDGTYTISYYSVDNAGNVESEKNVTVNLDKTSPDVTLEEQPEFYNSVPIVLNFTITDGGSRIDDYIIMRYKVGMEEGNYGDIKDQCVVLNEIEIEEGINLQVICEWDDGKKDGKFYFYVNATDKVGNEGQSNEVETVLDRQNPLPPILDLPESGMITNNQQVLFNWTTEDNSSNLFESREEGMSGIANSTIQIASDSNFNDIVKEETVSDDELFSTFEEGEYYWRVKSTDKAGNEGTWSEVKGFTIDLTAPEINGLSVVLNYTDGDDVYVGNLVTASATVIDLNGVDSVTFSLGNVECDATPVDDTSWACDINTTTLDDGEYSLNVTAVDVAENEEVNNSLVVIVDNTGPVTTIVSPEKSSLFASDFEVNIEDSDDGSGLDKCYYRVYSDLNADGDTDDEADLTRDWTERTCNSSQIITVGVEKDCRTQGENLCKVQVKAVDITGNDNWAPSYVTKTRKFSIDWTNPPQILNSGPSGTVINKGTAFYVETNKPATCKYDIVYKSNFDAMNFTMEITGGKYHSNPLTELLDKQYAYYVLCQDSVGNEMTQTVSILFDVDTRGEFSVTIPETKGDYLSEGWNQFFLPNFVLNDTILISPYTVETVLESIDGSYDMLYHFDGSGWTSYVPGREVNDLTEFNGGGFPYFIDMNVAGERIEIV